MKPKLIIAIIKKYDSISNKSKTVGYRFYDIKRKEIEDFNTKSKQFLSYLKSHKNEIENATWDIGKLTGTPKLKFSNGAESRYPVIDADTGQLVGNNPLVIAAEFIDGYLVVGPFGEVFEWTKAQAIAYAKLNGIANGKCLVKSSTEYISAISGNYPYIEREIVSPENQAKYKAIDKFKADRLKQKEELIKNDKDNISVKTDKGLVTKNTVPIKNDIDFINKQNKPIKDDNYVISIKNIDNEKDINSLEQNEDKLPDVNPIDSKLENESSQTFKPIYDDVASQLYAEGIQEEYPDVEMSGKEVLDIINSDEVQDVKNAQKYSDDFYKQLEPTFGGKKSVDILKYMIEERDFSIEAVYQLIDDGRETNKYVPTLIGLLTKYTDSTQGNFDDKLDKLCRLAIEPEVLDIAVDLFNIGVEFNEVWDADIIAQKRNHNTNVWAFPLTLLEERIANYIASTGRELYGCSISSDGVYYNGYVVNVPGYKISGVNPKYITITNEMGKTKKVKKA